MELETELGPEAVVEGGEAAAATGRSHTVTFVVTL